MPKSGLRWILGFALAMAVIALPGDARAEDEKPAVAAHFFMRAFTFGGAAFRRDHDLTMALVLAPFGGGVYVKSLDGLEHGLSVFGPAVNVLGFVRDDPKPDVPSREYCTRGNPLCALVLGGINLDLLQLKLGSGAKDRGVPALTAGATLMMTSTPTQVYTAGGGFIGVQYTPTF